MGHVSSLLGFVVLVLCALVVAALRKKQNVYSARPKYAPAWPVYARPVMSE